MILVPAAERGWNSPKRNIDDRPITFALFSVPCAILFNPYWPASETDKPLSIVNCTLLLGVKPLPCKCKMPPSGTTLLPLIVRLREVVGISACAKIKPLVIRTTTVASATISHLVAIPNLTLEVAAAEPYSREVCDLSACRVRDDDAPTPVWVEME